MYVAQKLFTPENIGKYILSPYTEIYFSSKSTVVRHTLSGEAVKIKGKQATVAMVLQSLSEGVSFDELCDLLCDELGETCPESWISTAMHSGIVE